MFIALKSTAEHWDSRWGNCDIELLRKLSLCLNIVKIVGEPGHGIFPRKSVQCIEIAEKVKSVMRVNYQEILKKKSITHTALMIAEVDGGSILT